MEVRVVAERKGRRQAHPIAITMRTPGHDLELAAGFLFCEGAIRTAGEIARIDYCASERGAERNVVEVTLAPGVEFEPESFTRHVYTTSSCGVCGKASLERLAFTAPGRPVGTRALEAALLSRLPEALAAAQPVFAGTGGLHAAGLFDAGGELLVVREDVGRHNALDKLVGSLLLGGALPASETVLLVSGRASFELVQKAVMAGIPTFAAVGAPSSLAVETAAANGLTLVGFVRGESFNVYSGAERIGGLGETGRSPRTPVGTSG